MAFDVFLSYSSKDKTAADAACSVLEAHGIRCWVAPRDILPGADWGESIIEAINGCKLMVLIFSGNANASQQVKREVERVVNRGLPIIPVRIEDVLPSQALEYFLSTPHWLDAFTPPLERHLEHLAATVKQLLAQPGALPNSALPQPKRSRWKSLSAYIKPAATAAAVLIALLLLALIAMRDLTPPLPPAGGQPANAGKQASAIPNSSAPQNEGEGATPSVATGSPLVGRWQGEVADEDGHKYSGLVDLEDGNPTLPGSMLTVTFADTFPFPYCDMVGQLYLSQDGTWVPPTDKGNFTLTMEMESLTGTFALQKDTLVMSYGEAGELRWQRSRDNGSLSTAAVVLPPRGEWPVNDVAALARRSLDYVRGRWQEDAALLSVEMSPKKALAEAATVSIVLHYYSNAAEEGLRFEPAAGPSVRLAVTSNGNASRALPARFRELREVMTEQGLSPAQLLAASLEHKEYYDYQDIRANNAILPPCPYEKTGYYWILKTEQAWHYVVAEKP